MTLIRASAINNDLAPHYRVVGYYLADDQEREVAGVRDMLVDRESRVPRYLMIEIGGLMGIRGRQLLIPWSVVVRGGVSRLDIRWPLEHILVAPAPFVPDEPTLPEEEAIHRHFAAEFYWASEPTAESAPPPPVDTVDVPDQLELENDDKA